MNDYCVLCGRQADHLHHLMPGRSQRSMFDEIKIPVCANCHQNIHAFPVATNLSRMLGQAIWEIKYMNDAYKLATEEDIEPEARAEFMKKNFKSYL